MRDGRRARSSTAHSRAGRGCVRSQALMRWDREADKGGAVGASPSQHLAGSELSRCLRPWSHEAVAAAKLQGRLCACGSVGGASGWSGDRRGGASSGGNRMLPSASFVWLQGPEAPAQNAQCQED